MDTALRFGYSRFSAAHLRGRLSMLGLIPIVPEATDNSDLHIASLIMQVRPELYSAIYEQVQLLHECTCYSDTKETGAERKENIIVVVIEVTTQGAINTIVSKLNQLLGVLNVNLVYHYCDTKHSMKDELDVRS